MIPKPWQRSVFGWLSRWVAPHMIRALRSSSHLEVQGEVNLTRLTGADQNFILAFWHGQMIPLVFYFEGAGYYTFISPHRDGEYIARALKGLGHHALRTSLRDRRIRALGEALKLARRGETLVVTPDGPIGPRFRAKPGIVRLSEKTKLPILPVAGLAGRARFLSSWDRFCLPLPLGEVRIRFGAPLRYWQRDSTLEAKTEALQERLNRLTREVARVLPRPERYLDDENLEGTKDDVTAGVD